MKKIIVVTLTLLVSCSPEITVYTDYDPDYDLWEYATFNWAEKTDIESEKNPLYYSELNDKRIKTAVNNQLIKKGYQLIEENPELILHYHIVVDEPTVLMPEPNRYYYSPYWLPLSASAYQYTQGTLILDMMDSKSNHLIWRGWGVSILDDDYTPTEIDNLINQATEKIFRNFPKKKYPATIKEIDKEKVLGDVGRYK